MKPFKKILFPVDLSDVSPKIMPWVIMMAERFEAQIHLLFVARTFEHFSTLNLTQVTIDDFSLRITEGAEEKLKEFAETEFKEYSDCITQVINGDPSHKILDYAASENIDLIIMGTHGRKGLNRVFFGSVADNVVKMSPVPVMTINPYRVIKAEW
ncbi:universal stress protein [Thermodesulfobacteriota bacterium]